MLFVKELCELHLSLLSPPLLTLTRWLSLFFPCTCCGYLHWLFFVSCWKYRFVAKITVGLICVMPSWIACVQYHLMKFILRVVISNIADYWNIVFRTGNCLQIIRSFCTAYFTCIIWELSSWMQHTAYGVLWRWAAILKRNFGSGVYVLAPFLTWIVF